MNVVEEFYLVESIKLAIGVAEANRRSNADARSDPSVTPGSDYWQARTNDMMFAQGQITGLREALMFVENLSKVVGQ